MGMSREDVRAIDQILEGQHMAKQRETEGYERMANVDTVDLAPQTLEDAFPPGVEANFVPFGSRMLVQMRRPQMKSKGGIVLSSMTQQDISWNQQVAKVVALGPLCFKNRETAVAWPEGMWCDVGDYVRVPRWNGDRIVVPAPDAGADVTFVCFNDYEIIGKVLGDPLKMRVYIL